MPDGTNIDTTANVSPVDLPKAKNVSEFLRMRKQLDIAQRSGQNTPLAGGKPEDVEPDEQETTDAPESGNLDAGSGDPDDGGGETGNARDDKDASPEGLPEGIKKRLARAKKQTEREQERNSALQSQIEQLTARLERLESADAEPSSEPTPTQTPKATPKEDPKTSLDPDTKLPEDQHAKLFEYPVESDYKVKGVSEADARRTYLEDVDRWMDNRPLVGGKYAAKAKQTAPSTPKPAEPAPKAGETRQRNEKGQFVKHEPVDKMATMFKDAREAIDEGAGDVEDLAADFFDAHAAGRFALTEKMLEWFAYEDDVSSVAAEFLKSPRKANKIFMAPPNKQATLLKDFARSLKGEGTTSKGGDKAPVVNKLGGRPARSTSSPERAVKNGFQAYEAARRAQDKGRRGLL